jgi:hypothetical protein
MFEKQKRNFNPTINKLLDKFGDDIIEQILIFRKPINPMINKILNVLSLGQLNENLKGVNYDNLFHLFMVVICGNNNWFIIEKNERINIAKLKSIDNLIENKKVNLNNQKLTLEKLFINTIENIGLDNFFIYRSHSWNCQNFIYNILKFNNLLNNELNEFILQDTQKIFYKLGYLKKISDNITNTAANINIITKGGKLKNKNIIYINF